MPKFTPAVQELENTFAERQTGPFVDRGGSVGFDVRAYGAVLDGASDDAAALNAALAAAQAAGVQVVTVAGGAARIASNVTIPSGVTLRVLEGATIKPAAGATLTINGTFDAGLYKVFDLSEGGSVVLGTGAVEYVVPHWWGAVGDGATDDRAALAAADATGRAVMLPAGTYRVGSSLTLASAWQVRRGGLFRPALGATLTIKGSFDAGLYKVFDTSEGGSIALAHGSVRYAVPHWWGAAGDGSQDDAPAIQAAIDSARTVFFPRGTYLIHSPIVVGTQKQLVGEGGGIYNTARAVIRGYVADLGEGAALLQLNSDNDTNVQDVLIQGLHFRGDNETIRPADLTTAQDTGLIGIDVAHVKDHVMIRDCSFRALKRGIGQRPLVDYTGQVYITNCTFMQCYRGVEFTSTTPVPITNCDFLNCYDWIAVNRVSVIGCCFNNSSYSQEYCNVSGEIIVAIGCWFEGGNNYLDVSGSTNGRITAIGNKFAACFSSQDTTKHVVRFANNAQLVLLGNSSTVNNRIGYGAAVTDWSTVTIIMEGNDWPTYSWDAFGTNPEVQGAAFFSLDALRRIVANVELRGIRRLYFDTYVGPELSVSDTLANKRTFNLTFGAVGTGPRRFFKLHILGTNNGAGGTAAYYGEYVVQKQHGDAWTVIHIGGTDGWTVSLSNVTSTGMTITINGTHSGNDLLDRVSFGERNFNFTVA